MVFPTASRRDVFALAIAAIWPWAAANWSARAGVGAWNVVEAVAVKAADLHVLHRLGLHRHVGGLRRSGPDQSCDGTEKKTFDHLLTSFVAVVAWVAKLNLSYWRRNVRSRSQQAPNESFLVCCKNASAVHISRSVAKPSFLK
jgi:hypothetical protein